jgi:hypothetical protein
VIVPFLIFWIILFVARGDLGWRGIALCVGIWLALLVGFIYAGISPYLFVTAQAALDCILILVIFKGDIRIR